MEGKENLITQNSYTNHLWSHSWKDEFWYLENKKIRTGIFKVLKRIKSTPNLPCNYYRQVLKYILYFLFSKDNVKNTKNAIIKLLYIK